MDDLPPWLQQPVAEPMAPVRQPPRRITPAAQRAAAGDAIHWGVVVLTLFTALSVLFGSHGVDGAQPRELLPVMIVKSIP